MLSTWLSVCLGVSGSFCGGGMGEADVGDGAVEGGFGAGGFGTEKSVHDGRGCLVDVLFVADLVLLAHRAQSGL